MLSTQEAGTVVRMPASTMQAQHSRGSARRAGGRRRGGWRAGRWAERRAGWRARRWRARRWRRGRRWAGWWARGRAGWWAGRRAGRRRAGRRAGRRWANAPGQRDRWAGLGCRLAGLCDPHAMHSPGPGKGSAQRADGDAPCGPGQLAGSLRCVHAWLSVPAHLALSSRSEAHAHSPPQCRATPFWRQLFHKPAGAQVQGVPSL